MYLHVLSEAAELLQLKDTRTSSYVMGISDLIRHLDEAEGAERELDEEADDAQKRSLDLAAEWDDLERVKQQLEEAARERETHGKIGSRVRGPQPRGVCVLKMTMLNREHHHDAAARGRVRRARANLRPRAGTVHTHVSFMFNRGSCTCVVERSESIGHCTLRPAIRQLTGPVR
jgi:hypothetical protein